MAIRYDDDESHDLHHRPTNDGVTGASVSRGRLRRAALITGTGVLALALVAAITWQVARNTPPPADPATTANREPGSEPRPRTAAPPPYAQNFEVAPGLWTGTATATTGNSDELYGTPIGWPQTVDGAVAAAFNYDAATSSPAYLVDDTGEKINKRIFTPEGEKALGYTAEDRRNMRARFRLTENAEVLEPNGTVSSKQEFYYAAYPWYGAYKVEQVNSDLSEVRVRTWMPLVFGTGTDDNLSEVYVNWVESALTMRWWEGDWRIAAGDRPETRPENQAPDDTFTNQSYQVRRDVLGDGWIVLADSTEDPRPGSVLTK